MLSAGSKSDEEEHLLPLDTITVAGALLGLESAHAVIVGVALLVRRLGGKG